MEPAQARVLAAEELQPQDVQEDPEALLARWARESHPEVEAAFERASRRWPRAWARSSDVLGALDPTLRAAADGARGRVLHQLDGLHEKATRALKKRDQGARRPAAPHARRRVPRRLAAGAGTGPGGPRGPARPRPGRRGARAAWSRGRRAPVSLAMKIGITCYPTVGGSGAVAAELGKQLARRGHDDPLHLVPAALPARRLPREHRVPRGRRLVATRCSSTRRTTWRWPPRWRRSAREHALDLLHVHYAIPHAIAGFLAQQMLGSAARPRWSRRCTAPTSRSWARTAPSSRSRASGSSAPTASRPCRGSCGA